MLNNTKKFREALTLVAIFTTSDGPLVALDTMWENSVNNFATEDDLSKVVGKLFTDGGGDNGEFISTDDGMCFERTTGLLTFGLFWRPDDTTVLGVGGRKLMMGYRITPQGAQQVAAWAFEHEHKKGKMHVHGETDCNNIACWGARGENCACRCGAHNHAQVA